MPDEQGHSVADEEAVPDTPLHAYKEKDRRDEVKGDADALASGDAEQMSRDKREEEDEPELPKH